MLVETLPLSHTRKVIIYPLVFLSVLGAVSIWLATVWGIGVSPDSIVYISGASSLLGGHGFSMPLPDGGYAPITHYPPFYSALLALIAAFGQTTAQAARWLAPLLFMANILLIAWIAYTLRPQKPAQRTSLAVIAAFLSLTSLTLLDIHAMAWTEAPFVLLGLGAFVLLSRTMKTPNWRVLALCAILMGFATLLRYAGVAYIAAGALTVLLFRRAPLTTRLRDSVLFGLLALIPFVPWILRNLTIAGTATNRNLTIQPLRLSHLQEAISAFSSWFLFPDNLPLLLKVAGLLILSAIIGVPYLLALKRLNASPGDRRTAPGDIPTILIIFLLFIPIYLATIIATNMTLDVYTPFDYRILSPIFAPLLLLTLYSAAHWYEAAAARFSVVRPLIVLITVAICLLSLSRGARFVQRAYLEGLGFNNQWWHQSETLARLQAFPSATPVYSNAPEAVYLHTSRPAGKLPRAQRSINGELNPDYEAELSALRQALEDGGIIVLFDLPWRDSSGDAQNLSAELPLRISYNTGDGRILSIDH